MSVIIPVLNEELQIADAIRSAQNAAADEIIVADGGSSDRTVEIARSLGASLCPTVVRGRALQQNAGAKLAGGDVLLFLHADCRLPGDGIRELRRHFERLPDATCGCFQQQIDAQGLKYRMLESGNLWRARVLKWVYGDQGIFVRSEVFRRLEGFPEVPLMEDLLLMKRLKKIGPVAILNSRLIVSARRWEHRGVVTQTMRNWAFLLAAHAGVSPATLARFYPNVR